jgi:hypothetical protein
MRSKMGRRRTALPGVPAEPGWVPAWGAEGAAGASSTAGH